jgi:hypothetical protein
VCSLVRVAHRPWTLSTEGHTYCSFCVKLGPFEISLPKQTQKNGPCVSLDNLYILSPPSFLWWPSSTDYGVCSFWNRCSEEARISTSSKFPSDHYQDPFVSGRYVHWDGSTATRQSSSFPQLSLHSASRIQFAWLSAHQIISQMGAKEKGPAIQGSVSGGGALLTSLLRFEHFQNFCNAS